MLWELRMINGRQLIAEPDLFEPRTLISAKTGAVFRAELAVKEAMVFGQIGQEGMVEEEEDEDAEEGFEVPETSDEYWLHYMVQIGKFCRIINY